VALNEFQHSSFQIGLERRLADDSTLQ